jgi:hypothetical protein
MCRMDIICASNEVCYAHTGSWRQKCSQLLNVFYQPKRPEFTDVQLVLTTSKQFLTLPSPSGAHSPLSYHHFLYNFCRSPVSRSSRIARPIPSLQQHQPREILHRRVHYTTSSIVLTLMSNKFLSLKKTNKLRIRRFPKESQAEPFMRIKLAID